MNGQEEKVNILLVDDNPKNLVALESILDRPDVELFRAASGNEALAQVLEHEFALVLMDVQMPEMDGFETAALMRGIEKSRHIPIIFVTAINKEQKYVFKGYESGAVDYLFKPLEPEILNSKVNIFIDLYRQRKTIKRQSLELEKKITELNAAFLELQKKEKLLEQKTRQLENSNQELKEFAYVVSHDLKATLRGINSLVDWLNEDYAEVLDEQGRRYLQLLQDRVKRMHDLIEGILQYSRVGRIEDERIEIDLNRLVAEVIDLVAPPEHITVKIVNPLPTLVVERVRIIQVFQNLISNAVKYMDKPEGRVEISCQPVDGFWEFRISDNGPGIDEKYFAKIFQIFQTLAPRDKVEGTGIGLSLVKKIVEKYGGTIRVESEVGKGSTFIFTLPRRKEDRPEEPKKPGRIRGRAKPEKTLLKV